MAKDKEDKKKDFPELVGAACAAYGIAAEHVFAFSVAGDTATVLTVGGSRVRYRAGDEKAKDFTPLRPIAVTGVNPEAARRKPVAGKKR